ncbi:unnamed protein product [Dibothriocephalus latus]|uniref:Uncharacterized protein n=1 Tax=Dibothriocephalus latus TaxID=60516 RepID=A0A3P7RD94_DIBLA|nr:unnamed protein product [Dibothriocephalus latus]
MRLPLPPPPSVSTLNVKLHPPPTPPPPLSTGLSKFEALLNSFEGTVLVRIWGDNSTRWKEIMAELAGNIERKFLLDLPYWRVKNFLVLVSPLTILPLFCKKTPAI